MLGKAGARRDLMALFGRVRNVLREIRESMFLALGTWRPRLRVPICIGGGCIGWPVCGRRTIAGVPERLIENFPPSS
jgi:hypothetical protein